MKKIAMLAALSLTGCAYTAPGTATETIYSPGIVRGQIGDVLRIEDPKHAVVIYIRVGGNGHDAMQIVREGKQEKP